MKVLIDECLPRRLTRGLPGHDVKTVQQAGWSRKTNGELLRLMQAHFEVFITIDNNLIHQQNLKSLPIALIVLRAKSNKFEDIEPLIPEILKALQTVKLADVVKIGS